MRSIKNYGIALIGYHFGSKEGLYFSVFKYIAEDLGGQLNHETQAYQLIHKQITAEFTEHGSLSENDKKQSTDAIIKLMSSYASMLLEPKAENYAKLIIREQLKPTKAFEILWDNGLENVLSLITSFIALVDDRLQPIERDKLTALTLMGQVLIFRVARATVNKHMGWSEPMDHTSIESIKAQIKANMQVLLK